MLFLTNLYVLNINFVFQAWYAKNCFKTNSKGLGIETLGDVVMQWKSEQDPNCM